jgi:type I restriction enzyme R subunit
MSALLDEIITARKAKAIKYEQYLKRIAELAKRVEAGQAEDTPEPLKKSPALRALYNNLKKMQGAPLEADRAAEAQAEYTAADDPTFRLVLKVDEAVRKVRPDGWRGVQTKEQVIKRALYDVLRDEAEVERIFLIIKAQKEYW